MIKKNSTCYTSSSSKDSCPHKHWTRFFVLSSDRSSMTVNSRSGEWPLQSRRAILVPADDQVSSTDRCCCCQPLTANKTPLDILTLFWGQRMKFNCRGLTRGQKAWDYVHFFVKVLHCCWGCIQLPDTIVMSWMSSGWNVKVL